MKDNFRFYFVLFVMLSVLGINEIHNWTANTRIDYLQTNLAEDYIGLNRKLNKIATKVHRIENQ